MIRIEDQGRVRIITLDRPKARNAFNEKLYDLAADALIEAASDNGIAVAVITGVEQSFSSGNDLNEMAARTTGAPFENGRHGFAGFVDQLIEFPKPLLCAVNGLAVGIGATMLALSDLVFISTEAKAVSYTHLTLPTNREV